MPIQDLRDWIRQVEALGELTRVDGVDPQYELGGLVDLYQWDMDNPALLFDHIKGHQPGYRVLANVFTSMRRVSLSLNMPMVSGRHDFVQAWRERLKALELIPAEWVVDGPILDNHQTGDQIDITQFPAPLWHTGDGGRYLGTGDIVITRDPDTGWINCGTYRVQVHDPKTAGIMISPGKHGRFIRDKYWSRGQACPVAVSMGHDPLLLLMGGLEIDHGMNEYDVAGGIRGEPVSLLAAPYTGLPVPASAEIVIEGEIPPDTLHEEGPFGEWTGYYAGGQRDMPIIRVHSVLYRDNPIVLGCLPGKPPNDNTYFRSPLRAAMMWEEERAGVPGIVGVWSHEAGGGRLMNVVAVEQRYPGHAKQAGMALASCQAGVYACRLVVVVDSDIDHHRHQRSVVGLEYPGRYDRRCRRHQKLPQYIARSDGLQPRRAVLLQQPHDHRRLPAFPPSLDLSSRRAQDPRRGPRPPRPLARIVHAGWESPTRANPGLKGDV